VKLDIPPSADYKNFMRQVHGFRPNVTPSTLLLLALLISGCATNALNSRKQANAEAYAALSREHKVAVDMGRVSFGMNTNAAYIAWGAPSVVQINGSMETWIYHGSEQRRHKSPTVRAANGPLSTQPASIDETSTTFPHHVIQARITFEEGLVKEWSRRVQHSFEENYLEHR